MWQQQVARGCPKVMHASLFQADADEVNQLVGQHTDKQIILLAIC